MSSYNYSYNVLINRLEAFAAGHFLIKRFTHGQIDLADQLQDDEYPFMHVVPEQIRPVDGGMQFDFMIMFADIPRDKEYKAEYQREVISDCVRLGQDLIAEVKNGLQLFGFDVQLVNTPTFEPFMEEQKNTVTGVSFTLSLEVPWDWSACDIPAIWSVGGSSTGGSGTGYGITLQTNGVNNAVQSLLNLEAGTNITITDNGNGTITIDSTGGGGGGSPYVSTEWNANHTTAQGNQYVIGDRVWYNGSVYACIANNDGINPSNPTYWTLQSAGYRLRQTPVDWNASSGDYQILNKPTLATVATTGDYNDLINTPAPQGLQDVITTDANLSIDNKITGNNNYLQFDDNEYFLITPNKDGYFQAQVVNGALDTRLNINASGALLTTTGAGVAFEIDQTKLIVKTPNVHAGTASVGQVLTLQNASTGAVEYTTISAGSGTVTSVGLTMPAPLNPAFSVTGSPVTTSGTLAIGANGTSAQYVDGTGALQSFPALSGFVPYTGATQDVDLDPFKLSAKSVYITGTAGNGHLHLKHQSADATATGQSTALWADSNGDIKWKNDGNYKTILKTSGNTADRTYTFPDADATLVGTTRSISTSSPLSGGGDLSANRTLSIADAVADGTTKGAAAFTASDFNSASGVISLDYANGQKASAAQPGFLTAADWSTFNAKPSVNSMVFCGMPATTQGSNSTVYWGISGGSPSLTESLRQMPMPTAGTLRNLYIRLSSTQSNLGSLVFNLRKNGVNTGITVTFTNADGANVTKSDTTNTVSVVAGDLINLQSVNNAATISASVLSFSFILQT